MKNNENFPTEWVSFSPELMGMHYDETNIRDHVHPLHYEGDTGHVEKGLKEKRMNTIHKYRVPFMEVSEVVMPKDAQIIRVDGLDGAIWMWAVVDTEQPLEKRTFHLFKTGGEMPTDIHKYVYRGCGAIFIQMELMMYIFELPGSAVPIGDEPKPFDWKAVQESP